MATKGEYLVNRTVEDCTALIAQLEHVKRIVWRTVERMEAIGAGPLDEYNWPDDYSKAQFVSLYNALDGLPNFVIDDDTRDKIFDLLSSIQ
jgi:hypothetical protein